MSGEGRPELSSGWLALPLFVGYTGWMLVAGVGSLNGWTILGFVLASLPLYALLLQRAEGLSWLAPPIGILLGFLLGLLGLSSLLGNDSAGLSVLAGVLIGFPLAVSAAIVRWGPQAPLLLVVTLGGLVDVLTTHAALDRLASEGLSSNPVSLTIASGQVTYDQMGGFAGLFGGSGSVTLPLQTLDDPLLWALVVLALVGAFVGLFRLDTASGRPVPVDARALLGPVAMGVLGATGFELVAARAPQYALLVLAASALAVVAVILWLARPRRVAAPPAAPTVDESAASEGREPAGSTPST